jgi:tRNA threonylcarbamoyl adenosine modification protein YeaZ
MSGGRWSGAAVLAVDAAGEGYGAAVLDDGHVRAARRVGPGGPRASAGLLPLVAEVLAASGLTAAGLGLIAVVDGPGSYTGLRVALATAKGLALAGGCPLVGVDALAALAFAAGPVAGDVFAALPAGRGRLYGGRLRWAGDRPCLREGPVVVEPDAWQASSVGGLRVGVGAERPEWAGIDPAAVARLGALLAADGAAVAAERLLPRYAGSVRLGPAPTPPSARG